MGKIFKRGLIALAPVAISIAIIIWLFDSLEGIFRVPLQWLVGEYYFRGMGVICAFIFIFIVGIIINNFVIQKFTGWIDKLFTKIPLVKTLYNSVGDMMGYFQPKDPTKAGKMVVVDHDGLRFLAIMTREDLSGFPKELGEGDRVAVYIPLSYQIGGITTAVPRSSIRMIDMSVEQGMRFVVTAGMAGTSQKGIDPNRPKS